MALLETKNLGIAFGGLHAVEQLNLQVQQGQLLWADWPKRRRKNDGV